MLPIMILGSHGLLKFTKIATSGNPDLCCHLAKFWPNKEPNTIELLLELGKQRKECNAHVIKKCPCKRECSAKLYQTPHMLKGRGGMLYCYTFLGAKVRNLWRRRAKLHEDDMVGAALSIGEGVDHCRQREKKMWYYYNFWDTKQLCPPTVSNEFSGFGGDCEIV